MSSYYDRYMRDLSRINAMRLMLAQQRQTVAPPGPMDIALDAIRRAKTTTAPFPVQQAMPKDKGPGGILGFIKKAAPIATPGLWLAKEGSETSPGRAVLDLLSRGTYASANAQLETEKMRAEGKDVDSFLGLGNTELAGRQIGAFWRGLKGEDKTTYADVERFTNPNQSNLAVGAKGLAKDILLDPISYLPVAGAVKVVGNLATRGQKAVKPLEATVEAVSKGADVPVSQEAHVTSLLKDLKSKPESPFEKIQVTPTDVSTVVKTAEAEGLLGATKQVPKLKYSPDLDIPAPFKVEDVEEALPPTGSPTELPTAPKAEKTPGQAARLAQARAAKAAILQDETYTIGKYTVGDLLKAARGAEPTRAKMVEKIIDDEVKRVVKSGDLSGIPQKAQLYGRSGEKAAFGLDIDQLADLFNRGEIGGYLDPAAYGKKSTEKFLKQFPIHDPSDLETVFLNTAKGERVSLGTYLRNLGVEVKAATTKGVVPLPKVKQFNVPTKTTTSQVERKFGEVETIRWMAQNQGKLEPEEMLYLRSAGSRKEFTDRLQEIKAKTVVEDFGSIDNLIAAIQSKLIPDTTVQELFKKFGVKSVAGLKAKADKILDLPKGKVETGLKQGIPAPNPKLERLKSRVEDDFNTPKVTSAEELAAQGTPLKKPLPELNPGQLEDLSKSLPWAVLENLVDPADVKKYPFLTDIKKAKRTSNTPGQGRARNIHGWNKISQADVFRKLVRSAATRYPIPRGLKGKAAFKAWAARADSVYDDVMPSLRAAERALQDQGVRIISGTDNAGLMLTLTDVLDSLPPELVKRHLFNPRTSAMPTDFIDAADGIVRSLMGNVPLDVARENAQNIFKQSRNIKTLKTAERVAGDLTNALIDNAEVILQRVELNYAQHGVEVGQAVQSMTDDVINNVVTKYANPNISIGETFGDFAMRSDDISKKGRQIDAPKEAYEAARDSADVTLATVLRPGDFAEAKAAKEYTKATTQKEITKVGVKQSKSRSQEGLELIDPTVDLGDRYQTQLLANAFRANVPMLDKVYTMKDALGRAFVADYGHAQLHTALRIERSVTQDFARMHRGLIASLHDSIQQVAGPNATRYTQEAFKHLQGGTKETGDPVINQIMQGLQSSIDLSFGSSVDKVGGFAQRNGIFADHLNEIMDYYKAPKNFRFDPEIPISDQWKAWEDVTDPLSLLDIVHASMQRASVEVTLGRDFTNQFGVKSAHPGYVKVTDKGRKSKIARFIDTDMYYPREIVEQMKYLDDVLKGSISGIKNPTAAAIIGRYDSIIHAWKSGLTIYRPGHHVRNLVGDVSLAFFDGVTDPRVYYKATKVLATRSKAYKSWDGLKALEEGTPLAGAPSTGKTVIRVGGKKKSLTDDQIWRAAFDQGIIPDYRTLEDIAFNADQSVKFPAGKGMSLTRPLGGRGQRVAGSVSTSRDHMVRIAHFIHAVEHGNYKTLAEAFDQAGARVRKWHPDGADLTNFENKVMRRSFMFYSWMRKAIPLVVETLVMKPGKAVIFPKALYNFAEANGVDLDSLGNPFPVDQLFPEFITDQIIGPQYGEAGDYGGINPGEPVTEMTSQWGGSAPQHGIGGALSPIARIPIEMYTGVNMGTGSKIMDKSDYADSQIPGLGYVARATGRSVTGLGEPTSDVERQLVEPGFNQDALVNFLTGIGLRDYSKPNYIRRAELEKRDAAREARGG